MRLPHFGLSFLEFLVGTRPRCHSGFLDALGVTFFGVHSAVDDDTFDSEFQIRHHTGGCWIHAGSGLPSVTVSITMQDSTLVPWVSQMLASAEMAWQPASLHDTTRNTGTAWCTRGRLLVKHIRLNPYDELCLTSLCSGTSEALVTYRLSAVRQQARLKMLRRAVLRWLLLTRAGKKIRQAVLEWACRPGNACMKSARARFTVCQT